jgi:hypothetical protein
VLFESPHGVFGNRLPALSPEIAESRFSGGEFVIGSGFAAATGITGCGLVPPGSAHSAFQAAGNTTMNTRLYVGNLAFHTTEDSLKRAFEQCGSVVETTLVLDRETGRSRGFGFVAMGNADDARKALETMNGADLDGRTLRVNEAEERKPRGSFGGDGGRGPSRRERW